MKFSSGNPGQGAKLARDLFYCCSLLCNSNMVQNLLMFTSSVLPHVTVEHSGVSIQNGAHGQV